MKKILNKVFIIVFVACLALMIAMLFLTVAIAAIYGFKSESPLWVEKTFNILVLVVVSDLFFGILIHAKIIIKEIKSIIN